MDEHTIDKALWNKKVSPESYGSLEQYNEHVMEQYKVYVATTDQVTAWRNSANAFFLSIHTLILTAITLAVENGFQFKAKILIILPLVLAWILCYVWWCLIKSYRQLNRGKFAVIKAYEEKLPTCPFVDTEWEYALAGGKDPQVYQGLTQLEKYIPVVFGILYAFGALMLIWI